MSNDKHEISKVFIEAAQFDLLIIHLPDDEIDDHLTYFTRERGNIRKSLFDDLIMSKCIANIKEFIEFLNSKSVTVEEINNIRAEIVDAIIKHNPRFSPDNLVVNSNGVVKVRKPGMENLKPLTENDVWNEDVYSGANKSFFVAGNKKHGNKDKIKNIKDIPYKPIKRFWKRIQSYITIKQYEPDYVDIILGGKLFSSRNGFEQYIVAVCVVDIDDLYTRLDHEGLSKRVTPPILVHELYQECRDINPFLDFDIYSQDMDGDSPANVVDPFAGFHKRMETGSGMSNSPFGQRKAVKLFKSLKKEVLMNLGNEMKKRIIGQDEAVENVTKAIQRASVGLKEPDQPIGAFVFAGYSGVGKTYCAKILAEELTGDKRNLVTIDCSEYTADHEYAKLIGAPAGYVGHEQGGHLTNAVRKNPFCVVLFDEIEKASEKVHQLLLQIMDEGRLTDGKGQPVSFRDVVVVMTSNIGVQEMQEVTKTIGFGEASVLTQAKREKAIKDALKKKFKPEFINRITSVVHFNSLSKNNYLNIIELELEKLKDNLHENDTKYSEIDLVFDKSLHEYIYKEGVDEKMGARPLKRTIERKVSSPLALELLESDVNEFSVVYVTAKRGKLKIAIEQRVEIDEPPFYMKAGEGVINE